MEIITISWLAILMFLAALLYSSVGHAGASGYLAVMAIFGVAPEVMKPTALALNILVATITTIKFYRVGAFSWKILLPFALGSIPFAFIGGGLALPGHLYKPVVGIILIYAAYRLLRVNHLNDTAAIKPLPFWAGVVSGGAIGFLSGLTGVGGGIFISPLLLFMAWAHTRETAGISAAFILLNSIAGLFGNLASVSQLPGVIIYWAPAVVIGGFIGAEYGSKQLGSLALKRLLAVVLIIAGLKMLFT
jgi:uncharacterized membrane protein YfcA